MKRKQIFIARSFNVVNKLDILKLVYNCIPVKVPVEILVHSCFGSLPPPCLSYPWVSVKVKVKLLSRVWLFATPGTVAYQAPPSMGFSRQEYWSGLPSPSPGDLDSGIEPGSPAWSAGALPSAHQGNPELIKRVHVSSSLLFSSSAPLMGWQSSTGTSSIWELNRHGFLPFPLTRCSQRLRHDWATGLSWTW